MKTSEIVEYSKKALFSSEDRRNVYRRYRNYFYYGTQDPAEGKSEVNKVFGEIRNYLSLVYSPEHILIEPFKDERTDTDALDYILYKIADVTQYLITASKLNYVFLEAVLMALIDGTSIIKYEYKYGEVVWTRIEPENFGLLYEGMDIDDTEQIISHKSYLTRRYVKRFFPKLLTNVTSDNKNKESDSVVKMLYPTADTPLENRNNLGGMVVNNHIDYTEARNGEDVVEAYEVYYNEGKWHRAIVLADTVVMDEVIIRPPFVPIRPIPNPRNFWGISLVSQIEGIQESRNDLLDKIDHAVDLLTNPPTSVTGYQMNEEQIREEVSHLKEPNGVMVVNGNGIKVEQMLPKLDLGSAFNELDWKDMQTKFITGVNEIMMGQAQKNVRSGQYASMLAQFASTELKLVAETIENDFEDLITNTAQLIVLNDTTVYTHKEPNGSTTTYVLANYPNNFRLKVYAHTSSPITTEQNLNLMIKLTEAGIIPPDILIKVAPLPYRDKILKFLKDKAKAAQVQEMIQPQPQDKEKKNETKKAV